MHVSLLTVTVTLASDSHPQVASHLKRSGLLSRVGPTSLFDDALPKQFGQDIVMPLDPLQQAEVLVKSLPWPTQRALAVEWCESRDVPTAVSSEGAVGLFQELGGTMDPVQNVRDAFALWQSRGWEPWTSSETCWQKIS